MELLYHVTEQDIPVGPIERDRAHTEGVLHRSGIVFLLRSDRKVLLQHRSSLKKIFPDCYECSAAFHVTWGKTYQGAARRELREETGISAPLVFFGKFTHHDPPEHQVVACYSCRSDERVKLDSEEASGGEFYSIGDADRMVEAEKVTPWLRDGWKLAKKALEELRDK